MEDLERIKTLIIDFIKGLMQPLVTLLAIWIVYYLVSGGLVTAEQAWVIPLVVFGYWFADKSGILEMLFSKVNATKDDSRLLDIIQRQHTTIANQAYDLGESVPKDIVQNMKDEPKLEDALKQADAEARGAI